MDNTEYKSHIADYYNMDACDYESRYWTNPVAQQIRQSFREVVKSYNCHSMLEIGFGTGLDLVHFAKTHPQLKISGIDVSPEMVKISAEKLAESNCFNVQIRAGSVEEIDNLFPNQKFDLIYVFFGALNTVEDLNSAAKALTNSLNDKGVIILSYVNKWYIGGVIIDMARLRFKKAFARFKPVWGGYSPTHYLPGHCYTPKHVKRAFHGLKTIQRRGYTILHPAWFYTNINRKLGTRLRRVLWKIDNLLNRTFLWRFGEYGLLVFQCR
jgi:SAM-dependent methyltransferase